MSTPFLLFFLLLLAAAFVWLIRPGRSKGRHDEPIEDPDILEEAEDELQNLDAFATPEDAERDLPDWGPGAPRT